MSTALQCIPCFVHCPSCDLAMLVHCYGYRAVRPECRTLFDLVAVPLDARETEYHVDQWEKAGTPASIVADVPAHLSPFPGLSCPATLVNLSALERRTCNGIRP